MRFKILSFILPVIPALVIIGCGPPREGSHPLMIKADTLTKSQKYDEAVKSIKQYLKVNPESARAHQLLAQLYDENLNKPELAVYHYMLCLEDNPHVRGAADIRKFLRSARKRAYNSLKSEYNDANTVNDLAKELAQLKKLVQTLDTKNTQLVKVVEAYKKYIYKVNQEQRETKLQLAAAKTAQEISRDKINSLEKQLADKQRQINIFKTQLNQAPVMEEVDAPPPPDSMANQEKTEEPEKSNETETQPDKKNEAPPSPVEIKEKVEPAKPKAKFPDITTIDKDKETSTGNPQEYTVKPGDTLSSISRQFYGSARHYNKILEANKNIISSAAQLKTGQKLKIPHLAVPEQK